MRIHDPSLDDDHDHDADDDDDDDHDHDADDDHDHDADDNVQTCLLISEGWIFKKDSQQNPALR